MSTSVRITVDDYERMIAEGRFEPREEHHVELIEGEIVPMSPIGEDHRDLVDELTEWSFLNASLDQIRVSVQSPIGIPALDSMPEPDLLWLRRRPYRRRRPTAADVWLLVEVAQSSLAYDRGPKARLYAEAGIADYWIVNVVDECVEVHRDPGTSGYQSVATYRPGDSIASLAFPRIVFPVAVLFPPEDPEGE